MTVYYDYKTIVPGGWNPPDYKHVNPQCVMCGRLVSEECESYKNNQICPKCNKKYEKYEK